MRWFAQNNIVHNEQRVCFVEAEKVRRILSARSTYMASI